MTERKQADMYLNELQLDDHVDGFYILEDAYAKQSSNGKPFLSLVLADCSGSMEGKVWNYAGPVGPEDVGQVIKVTGAVTAFRDTLQVTVDTIRLAVDSDRYDLADLVPTAPIDGEKAWARICELVDSLEDGDYQAICRDLLETYGQRFRTVPAAKSVHHGFVRGLLMHTVNMAELADHMAGVYGEVIDRSLLLAGTILHDIAKCDEFITSDLGLVTDYSMRGNLLGHLVMGAQLVAGAAERLHTPEEKSVLLQHMLLAHHGEPEFGAAVRPICAESELLSYIDKIDSRMEIYAETLPEVPVGGVSKRIFALDHRIYHHS